MSETAAHLLARTQCRNSRANEEIFPDLEKILYLFFEPLKIKQFKPIFYQWVNETMTYGNPKEELQTGLPKVLVIDGRQAFKEEEFYGLYPGLRKDRSKLEVYRPTCRNTLICHAKTVVRQNLIGNIGMKLILVFAPSSGRFTDLVSKFDMALHKMPIMCKVIFVWDMDQTSQYTTTTNRSQVLAANRREISQGYHITTQVKKGDHHDSYDVTFNGTKDQASPAIHKYSFTVHKNQNS